MYVWCVLVDMHMLWCASDRQGQLCRVSSLSPPLYMGLWGPAQVARLHDRCVYPTDHLPSPHSQYFSNVIF